MSEKEASNNFRGTTRGTTRGTPRGTTQGRAISSEALRLILGLKVRNYRLDRKLSLVQLAKKSGVAVSYISEIEQGKKYPKPEKMIQLAQGLGIPYDELVSLQVDTKLDPLTSLMESELVQEFPFDMFGISPRDILNLFSDSPQKATAFLQTFLEIGRAYDMDIENFLLAALRTYQKQHRNYFPELEQSSRDFLAANPRLDGPPTLAELGRILQQEYGYRLDEQSLGSQPDLSGFRSIYKEGKEPTLYINPRLKPSQQAFILCREIGFCYLGSDRVRPATSSWLKVESFDHLLNNFHASYFAGALMLPQDRLAGGLQAFLEQETWDDRLLLDLLEKHQATPEMFLYRMSQLLPGLFGLDRIFYLRFTRDAIRGEVKLTKELNLTSDLVPYGLGLKESYCRRWLPLQQLEILKGRAPRTGVAPMAGIQKAHFQDSDCQFIMISLSRRMSLSDQGQSAMTIGIRVDEEQQRVMRFMADPEIPRAEVNQTCERCPLTVEQCGDRAAAPVHHQRLARQRSREKALQDFLDS